MFLIGLNILTTLAALLSALLPLVYTQGNGEVRLVGGVRDQEGRIEIYLNGQWGTICDDYWDNDDATVACRQLGYPSAEAATSSASFGQGTGQIWLDDVQCDGSEQNILSCANRGVGVHNCGHGEDAGVKCESRLRLVNGGWNYRGRVELFMNGEWGTVDEDPWDNTDAGVVCRELGFSYGGIGYKGAHFGQGTGPIWIDEVNCQGQETSLLQCPHQTDTSEDSHTEDVGVACNGLLRLRGGRGPYEGRVELFMNGEWGTVDDDPWDDTDAGVVCRRLRFLYGGTGYRGAHFGQGIGPIWIDDVNCEGNENNLLGCPHSTNTQEDYHAEDVGVSCNGPLRLVDGTTDYEGRIEIFMNGAWGTICDDSWDMADANVACRQLGYTAAEAANSSASYGEGIGQIWLDDVVCSGSEEHILACGNRGVGEHNCGHHEDAGVRCAPPVRLVSGRGSYEGRVEVFMKGEWGTIDEDPWDDNDATVVCRQLGFPFGGVGFKGAHFGQGTGPIWIDDVNCEGQEANLLHCSHNTDTREDSHAEDVGVACNGPLRLVGGEGNYQGRVELFMKGEWGTVDEDPWEDIDAGVVCRELGFHYGGIGYKGAHFGQGTGPIWIDNVNCHSEEAKLIQCPYQTDTREDSHAEDVGVSCNGPLRLVGGANNNEGRVEIFINGTWGTICDDYWDNDDANVACRQLGYSSAEAATSSASYGQGTGQIWLDDVQCDGSEQNILSCANRGVGVHNCGHSEDAGVRCEF